MNDSRTPPLSKLALFIPLILILLISSGCSTYTTNTDITFTSTHVDDELPIYVGPISESADKLSFLGQVEAYVRKPGIFDDNPTKDQVNYVLAFLGKQLGANAVTHVKYKESVGGSKLTATAQAIAINSPHEYNKRKNSIQKTLEKFGIEANEPTQLPTTPQQLEFKIKKEVQQLGEQEILSSARVYELAKALAEAEAKVAEKSEAMKNKEEFSFIKDEEEIKAVQHMISNTEYMMKIAKANKVDAIYKMAKIMKQELERHLRSHLKEGQKP